MASCYLCAAHIQPGDGLRRQVMTSQSARVYFSKRGGGSYGQTHGLRTLCATCAASLDRSRDGQGMRIFLSLLAAFIGCIAAVRMRDSANGGLSSLIFAFFLFGGGGLLAFIPLHLLHTANIKESEPNFAEEYPESLELDVQPIERVSVNREDKIEAEPYPGIASAMNGIQQRLNEFGISLFGCYGFSVGTEGARQLISTLYGMHPVRHFSGLNEWSEMIFQQTIARFSKETALNYASAKKASEAGSDDDFVDAFRPMFRIFPMLTDESFQPYLDRLGETLSQISELISE